MAQLRRAILRKGWLSDEELQESLAFCQLLPGSLVTQLAAHVGWRLRRGPGAAVALTTYMLPAFLLMTALSAIYFRFGQVTAIATGLKGLRAATVGIVAWATFSLARIALKEWRALIIALAATAAFLLDANIVLVLLLAGGIGMVALPRESLPTTGVMTRRDRAETRRALLWAGSITMALAGLIVAARWWAPFYPALGAAFVKINLLAFGGGYTAAPLMYDAAVRQHAWVSAPEFVDGLTLGQVTPGPVIITATFIGYKLGGLAGALFSTLCVFLPSAVLLVVLAPEVQRLRRLRAVTRLIGGLLAAFIGMLLFVLWQVAGAGIVDLLTCAIALGSIVSLRLLPNPIWTVLGAIIVALALGR